jgi:hypothetical protein
MIFFLSKKLLKMNKKVGNLRANPSSILNVYTFHRTPFPFILTMASLVYLLYSERQTGSPLPPFIQKVTIFSNKKPFTHPIANRGRLEVSFPISEIGDHEYSHSITRLVDRS